jgi:hypothetical protein
VVDIEVVPGRRGAALAVGVATSVVTVAALVLAVVNVGASDPEFTVHRQFFPTDVLIAIVYAPFGVFVLVRSGHVIGWALLLVGLGFSLTSLGIQYALLGVEHPDLPAYAWIVQLVISGWIVGVLTCTLVIPCLIGPRAPTGLRRVLALLAVLIAVSAGIVRYLMQIVDGPPNPISAGTGLADAAQAYDDWVIPIYFLLGLVAVVALAVRVRRGGIDERRPLGWVLASVATTTVAYLAFELGLSLGQPMLTIGAGTLTAAMLMLPAAIFVVSAASCCPSAGTPPACWPSRCWPWASCRCGPGRERPGPRARQRRPRTRPRTASRRTPGGAPAAAPGAPRQPRTIPGRNLAGARRHRPDVGAHPA